MVYWESQLTPVNDSPIVFDLTHLQTGSLWSVSHAPQWRYRRKPKSLTPSIALWSAAEGAAQPLGLLLSWGELVCPGMFRRTVTHGGVWGWKGPRLTLKPLRIWSNKHVCFLSRHFVQLLTEVGLLIKIYMEESKYMSKTSVTVSIRLYKLTS